MTILVTGSNGFVGKQLVKCLLENDYSVVGVDRTDSSINHEKYRHYSLDLCNRKEIEKVFRNHSINKVIHLAALAHSRDGSKYSWDDYYTLNVKCAKNVFDTAKNIPVLFISTVDVYGFTYSEVNKYSTTSPVSNYAKSKALAEIECQKLDNYDIFRLSPLYSEYEKRDIQKRYYLKYPLIAYMVGKGSYFEVLDLTRAVTRMMQWCASKPTNSIYLVKDNVRLYTFDSIKEEQKLGRAKIIVRIPRFLVIILYRIAMRVFGQNKYTYLLHKAVYPLRSN